MCWTDEVDAWAVALRAAGRARTTIGTRTDHVLRLGRAMECGPWDVTGVMLVEWAGGQSWARETRRSVRASVRAFYRWGVATGRTSVDPSESLPHVTPGPCPAEARTGDGIPVGVEPSPPA